MSPLRPDSPLCALSAQWRARFVRAGAGCRPPAQRAARAGIVGPPRSASLPAAPPRAGLRASLALAAILFAVPGLAAVGDPIERLPNAVQEAEAQAIGRELRCLVCQNQSIEDSDADLARDLRRIVRERVSAGDGRDQVIRFVHDRYGDFVLLRPPMHGSLVVLWAMPFLALAGGAVAIFMMRRRQAAAAGAEAAPLSEDERRRLADLEGGKTP